MTEPRPEPARADVAPPATRKGRPVAGGSIGASRAEPLVMVERVSFHFEGGATPTAPRFALKGVDLIISRGEVVALIGPNGAGKTTLARHLNGLLKPVAGRVLVAGAETRQSSVARLAAHVGYAFQNPDHQLFASTVAEDVAFGPRNLGLPSSEVDRRVASALARLGLEAVGERHPLLLGYGMRRLVALAGVLALETDMLVLDEPTAGLDRRAVDRVLAVVHERQTSGGAALLITHDLALVAAHATRVVLLHDGRVTADGPTRDVLTDAALLSSAGLTLPAVAALGRALAPLGVRPDALTIDELCDSYASAYQGLRTEG